jgi:hypothetical protein
MNKMHEPNPILIVTIAILGIDKKARESIAKTSANTTSGRNNPCRAFGLKEFRKSASMNDVNDGILCSKTPIIIPRKKATALKCSQI